MMNDLTSEEKIVLAALAKGNQMRDWDTTPCRVLVNRGLAKRVTEPGSGLTMLRITSAGAAISKGHPAVIAQSVDVSSFPSGMYLWEPAERGRLCVIRYKGPHYTGLGDVVARHVELELAQRIVSLLNGQSSTPQAGAAQSEPVAWLSEYDGHTDATTDPDTVRIWTETLHRKVTPLGPISAPPSQAGTAQNECTSPNEQLALDVLERLQTICERHGCEPGTNRLDWIEEMLGRSQAMREALELARAFIDPDANPPRISNREMAQKIDAALQSSQPEAAEFRDFDPEDIGSDGPGYIDDGSYTDDPRLAQTISLTPPSSSGQKCCEESRKQYAADWQRQIINAGGDENVALQAVTLAALNGLFDHLSPSNSPGATETDGGR